MDKAVLVGLLLAMLVAFSYMLISLAYEDWKNGFPGTEKWNRKFDERWMQEHSFCNECGEQLEWTSRDVIRYDQGSGRPYVNQTWACPNEPDHTPYGLIACCNRVQYVD